MVLVICAPWSQWTAITTRIRPICLGNEWIIVQPCQCKLYTIHIYKKSVWNFHTVQPKHMESEQPLFHSVRPIRRKILYMKSKSCPKSYVCNDQSCGDTVQAINLLETVCRTYAVVGKEGNILYGCRMTAGGLWQSRYKKEGVGRWDWLRRQFFQAIWPLRFRFAGLSDGLYGQHWTTMERRWIVLV